MSCPIKLQFRNELCSSSIIFLQWPVLVEILNLVLPVLNNCLIATCFVLHSAQSAKNMPQT